MRSFYLFTAALSLSIIHGYSEPTAKNNHITGLWLMGQSLCEGAQSLPIVTSADTGHGNFSFKRGVRTWRYGDHNKDPQQRANEQFVFTSLTAHLFGGLGETIANGLADHLSFSLAKSKNAPSKQPIRAPFLVSYAGQGGRMIDELSQTDQSSDARTPKSRQHGGGYYRTSLDDARRARQQAETVGKTFSIGALVWMQGEANGGPTGGINPSRWDEELPRPGGLQWYRDRLIAYRQQWSHDLQAITGQSGELPLFTYQTQGVAGEAQLMAADQNPHITMVGPHYMVASGLNSQYAKRYGAAIHLSADGERWYGEQVAKVMQRVLTAGEKWQPLRPLKATIADDRKSVLIDFHVPRPPLVLDHDFLARQHYKVGEAFSSLNGLQIRNSARAVSLIRSIEVASPTALRIRLASPLKNDTDYHVSYGQSYAGQFGEIASIREGPKLGEQKTTELLIKGDLSQQLSPLSKEGAFNVSNTNTAGPYTQASIRHLYVENGFTVLRFENRELRSQVKFSSEQMLTAHRPFAYGNLRDSDPAQSIYQFADKTYGNRAGQNYPLWNWCVLFKQFPISDQ